ncbi:Fic family protein [Xanthomonas sacchari]
MDAFAQRPSVLALPAVYVPDRSICLDINVKLGLKGNSFVFSREIDNEARARIFAGVIKKRISLFDAIGTYRRIGIDEIASLSLISEFIKPRVHLNFKDLLETHRKVMAACGSRDCRKVGLRRQEVLVGVNSASFSGFVAPPRSNLKPDMEWLIHHILHDVNNFLGFACVFFWFFLHSHPFVDGNGRTSRAFFLRAVRSKWPDSIVFFDGALLFLEGLESKKDEFIHFMSFSRSGGLESFLNFMGEVLVAAGWTMVSES